MASPIEDYAVIGDGRTAALIGKDGSLDWLCLPRFDSPALFAALLGDEKNGRWLLGPVDPAEVSRTYVDDTGVLETTYTTSTGSAKVLELMPVGDDRADIVRRITGVSGTVRFRHEWAVRMGYGAIRPWVHRDTEFDDETVEVLVATAGPDKLILSGDRLPEAVDGHHADEFDVGEGDVLTFAAVWVPSHVHLTEFPPYDERIDGTLEENRAWAARIEYDGPWRDAVVRSLITLRGLTHEETGGIVARR
jgi:GH15 family glucan-1,4-alpha-glucosidase